MTTELITQLNTAQTSIYSRSNIKRAYPDFDDTDIAGIQLAPEHVIVVRTDGTEQNYERQAIINAYQQFTGRLKDFFSYLGPNYRGPSIWRNNGYILFKGWHYSHKLGYLSEAAKLQRRWADQFIRIHMELLPQILNTIVHVREGDFQVPKSRNVIRLVPAFSKV